jgi:acylpyruvate hydrolase
MKIICIGRNYADHAKELNNPLPEKPVFFLKPDSALVMATNLFFILIFPVIFIMRLNLCIKINRLGRHIEQRFAHRYYDEIGVGIDFTARDLQDECKKKGLPWEIAKAFDNSAPLGKFVPVSDIPDHPGYVDSS